MIHDKPLHIMFDKTDGFIRVYDGTRYLVLFGGEKYNFIYNRIRYLARVKSGIVYFVSNNYAKLDDHLHVSLTIERTLTFHNIIIDIKSNYFHIYF